MFRVGSLCDVGMPLRGSMVSGGSSSASVFASGSLRGVGEESCAGGMSLLSLILVGVLEDLVLKLIEVGENVRLGATWLGVRWESCVGGILLFLSILAGGVWDSSLKLIEVLGRMCLVH